MEELKGEVVDIFSSIQGEGIFLGAKQIFIRFKRCNMKCAFCDEPRDRKCKEYLPHELMAEVKFLEVSKGRHHSVSLTGGEPLLYSGFLKEFTEVLSDNGFKAYLETNGTLPAELEKVIGGIDIVAMDFKLPSSTGERAYWDEHLEFLKIASRKKVFVKAVITPSTREEDIEIASELIKKVSDKVPFILQPAAFSGVKAAAVDSERLFGLLGIAAKNNLEHIRIIPQLHKLLNVK